ncbi:hypothetical protein KY333_00610 [Candidatus Woesearchaeota archaeon]|nr:hypothetical protein [Candidatus Woesearchaeota archaeon]MBW2994598.1 hypothetical protein [Candidatus Woesearchaeota archaeon]
MKFKETNLRKFALPILLIILLSAVASAQVLVSVDEKTVCGDGVREGHEMCEPDTDQDLCEEAGKILGIVMVCDERDCGCLPKRMDCGNEIREGAEYCDPGEKEDRESNDFCTELGEVFNETFTCDESSCLCVPEHAFGAPKPGICGDGNITGIEQCEKAEDCRADQNCKNCTCVLKEHVDVEKVLKELEENETKTIDATSTKPVKKGFDYKDLAGTILPAFLQEEFEEEKVNVYVELQNGSSQLIGVTTQHNVIQEVIDGKVDSATFDAFVKEDKAKQIIASENRADALQKAIEEGEVTYKPRGFFAKIWHWIAGIFK